MNLFDQIQTRYRWPFLLFWNFLVIAGFFRTDFGQHMERPLPLAMFAAAGFALLIVGFGLLGSRQFRKLVLYPGYSLDGHRFFLFGIGFAGFFIWFGAVAMLIGTVLELSASSV